jgi:tetratricopeptide (TPR) repeat protein
MLASQLRHHLAWRPAELAADVAAARDRLALMRAEDVSVGAAFALSYTDLTAAQQRLFRRLGLLLGPSIDAYAAAALDGTTLDAARRGLEDLYDQHLLTEPAPGRYQLHDLLREHARALAAADNPAESDAATGRLLDYYLHTALAAGRHFASPPAARRSPPGHPPAQAPDMSALEQAGGWLDAERANLHAAADYAADRARSRHAIAIPAAMSGFLTARGYWDQSAALHQNALIAARQAGDRLGEADTLTELGVLQAETGGYLAAAATLTRAVALYGDAGDVPGQAHALNQLGYLRVLTGDYPAAADSTQRSLALARSVSDRFVEADTLIHLGLVQQLTGDYPAAAASHQRALALFSALGNLQGQANALNDLGIVQQETGDYPAAAASHQQALSRYREFGRRLGQAEALNRLGELSSRTSATGRAREYYAQALAVARDLSAPLEEAHALEGLGQTHLEDGNPRQAATHLQHALTIYQRIGAPAARRVQENLQNHRLTSTTPEPQPAAPNSECHQPRTPAAPQEATE